MIPPRFSRNALEPSEQAELAKARIILIGLGGTGGFILENLVRMGAQDLVLYEDDKVGLTDLNRQILSTGSSIGKEKAEEALRRIKDINPSIRVASGGMFPDGPIPEGASVIFDGTDNLRTRIEASGMASRLGIPYVFCSAEGWRGIVSVFRGYDITKAFQIDRAKLLSNERKKARKVICPAAAISGSLACAMGINALLGKPFCEAPEALFFDLAKEGCFFRGKLG